jgi:hypothetical protein
MNPHMPESSLDIRDLIYGEKKVLLIFMPPRQIDSICLSYFAGVY